MQVDKSQQRADAFVVLCGRGSGLLVQRINSKQKSHQHNFDKDILLRRTGSVQFTQALQQFDQAAFLCLLGGNAIRAAGLHAVKALEKIVGSTFKARQEFA